MIVRKVCLIGMFPPPLHGMSLINEFMKKRVSQEVEPLIIDYSPHIIGRSIYMHINKIAQLVRCVFLYIYNLLTQNVGVVYLAISGGYGQIYDMSFVCISRLFCRKLYLHHHNYKYLSEFRLLTWLLCLFSGKKAVHIVACDKMAADLNRLYPRASLKIIVSGISMLDYFGADSISRDKVQSVGFLSNVSFDKGIVEFIEVAERANKLGLKLKFIIAGPYQNNNVKRFVESRIALLNNISYVGPVYGSDKKKYFDSIDVFLFPTKYESEGLVIHEAMSRNVPVIAHSHGCIEQIITDQSGLCLALSENYVNSAIDKIIHWVKNPAVFKIISRGAGEQYSKLKLHYDIEMKKLVNDLIYGGCYSEE